jgi:endonuclease/exonuclease/phosphatase family metal-dependent hydrolase
MEPVKYTVAAAAALLAACTMNVGPDQPWVPIADISGPLAPELSPAPMSITAHDGAIRIVTYNVEYAPDVPALVAAIQGEPAIATADVYLIQEIEAYPEEGTSRASRLAEGLGLQYVYVPARLRGTGTHGLAILARYPITNVMRMDLPDVSQTIRHRIAVSADIDFGTTTLPIIDLHLDTKLDGQERIAQLHPAVIDAPPRAIVGGDFNMSWVQWINGVPILGPGSDQAALVDSYMKAVGFSTPTADCGTTEQMYGIQQRLDAIYTRDLAPTFGGVPRVGPSDHWPLWIDVAP